MDWSEIQSEFRRDYRSMLNTVIALSLFNDVIVGEAVAAGLPIVDLRQMNRSVTRPPLTPSNPLALAAVEPNNVLVYALTRYPV